MPSSAANLQVARGMLSNRGMKPRDPTKSGPGAGPNQGEGDRISARHYNRQVREFVADGKVDDAARDAAQFVEHNPGDAERAERRARKGPKHPRVSVDALVAKGRSVIDRVRPAVERVVGKVRSKISRNRR
jgi:hypothetical protein